MAKLFFHRSPAFVPADYDGMTPIGQVGIWRADAKDGKPSAAGWFVSRLTPDLRHRIGEPVASGRTKRAAVSALSRLIAEGRLRRLPQGEGDAAAEPPVVAP